MRTKYFHRHPFDRNPDRGRDALPQWPEYTVARGKSIIGGRLQQALLLERAWASWFDTEYIVGPDYVASWEDRPMGFAMFKIWSPNSFLDRCAIENSDDPESFALFDLVSKKSHEGWTFIVYDIHDYHLSDEDETLIRLSL